MAHTSRRVHQWRYTPTPDDHLWMLRAVEAEGAPRTRVAAALANRFAWLNAKKVATYTTLAEFVQAYSAPVNPRRMRGGDIWERHWARATTPEAQRGLVDADRRRRRHRERSLFDKETYAAVNRAFLWPPELPSVTDFAAAHHRPAKNLETVCEGSAGENALYTADSGWRGYQIGTETVLTVVSGQLVRLDRTVLVAYSSSTDERHHSARK